MTLLFLDFESRSHVNLKTDGLDRYMTDAQPTIATWAIENGPVRIWDMLANPRQPQEFTDAINNPSAVFVAHNAAFDRAILHRRMLHFTRTDQWWCTRAQAYAHGLPGGLEALGTVLGLDSDHSKLLDGKRLIQLFCVPHDGRFIDPQEKPDDWEAFKNYAMRDIDALRAIYRRLPTHNFRGANLRYFWLDADINERGFAVDLPLVQATVQMLADAKGRADADITAATGGHVTALTQRNRLLTWLQGSGINLPSLRKSDLEAALQDDSYSPEQKFLIAMRLEGAKASGAKYKKALQQEVDGRLRYTMQFGGAGRTGRTAHKGFQPGNMPLPRTFNPLAPNMAEQHPFIKAEVIDGLVLPSIRNFSDGNGPGSLYGLVAGGPNTAAALALRHCIVAKPGHELVVADYKNIESVILAWYADEPSELQIFRDSFAGTGKDAYRLLYASFFGGSVDTVTEHERQAAKVVKLACGFGGSVGALVTMAVGYGLDLRALAPIVLAAADDKTRARALSVWRRAFIAGEDYGLEPDTFVACHCLVQRYRSANPRITDFKKQLGRAAERAVAVPGTLHEVARLRVWAEGSKVLVIELPSGYRLLYWQPTLERKQETDVETGEIEERIYLSFLRSRGGKMIRERSWPGLLVENVVQATANQILRHGALEIEAAWPGEQVLSVHDEIVCESPIGKRTVAELGALICKGWNWTKGLPLAASGWKGPRYGKR